MRGTVHKKTKIKCKTAQRAPVPTIQKSKAEVELTIFGFVCFFIHQANHTYSTVTGRSGERQLHSSWTHKSS